MSRSTAGEFFASMDDTTRELRRHRALIDAIGDGVVGVTLDGMIVALNESMVDLVGRSRSELLDQHVSTILSESDVVQVESAIESLPSRDGDEITLDVDVDVVVDEESGSDTPTRRCRLQLRTLEDESGTLEDESGTLEDESNTMIIGQFRPLEEDHPARQRAVDEIVDAVDVGVFVLDADFDVAWINEATEEYFGIDRASVLGRDKRRLIDETIRDRLSSPDEFADAVLATYDDNTYVERFECQVTDNEGAERWLEHYSEPIEGGTYDGGRVEYYFDVTDQRRAEREREDREGQFRSLVESIDEYAIFTLDPEGHVTSWNEGAERIKGYDREEILGEHFSAFYDEADRDAGMPEGNLAKAVERGSIEDEGWRIRADGSRFWANVTISSIRDEDGTVEGFAKVTRDMTDRREYEQALERERETVDQVLETSPVGIAVFDPAGSIVRANDRMGELLDPEDSMEEYALGDQELFDPGGRELPFDRRPVGRVLDTGERVFGQEIRVETGDGPRWLSVNAAPITDDTDEIDCVVATATDITPVHSRARKLERQRDELEGELEDVFDRMTDGFFAVDDEWRFTYVNAHAEELLDSTAEALLGEVIWEAFPDTTDSTFEAAYRNAMRTQEPVVFEEYYPPLDAWFEVRAHPSESGLSVHFADVTDRKARERELARFERAVEASGHAIYMTDANGRIIYVNPAFEEITGYRADEVIGETPSVLQSGEHDEAYYEELWETVLAGEVWEEEIVDRRKNGERYYAEQTIAPVRDDDGEIDRFVAVQTDVTERKERERTLEESERRYRALAENLPDGFVTLFDEDQRCTLAAGQAFDVLPFSPADLEGSAPWVVYDDAVSKSLESACEAPLRGEERTIEIQYAGKEWLVRTVPIRDESGAVFAGMAIQLDVTERKRIRRSLRRRATQQRVVADLGQLALETDDLDRLMAEATRRVADTLGTDYCKVLDLGDDAEELLLRQGVGWRDGIVGSATVDANENSQAGYTLQTEEPVVVEDLETETRFSGPDLLTSHDVVSGISVVIGSFEEPWGILGTHDTDSKSFTAEDVNFVQSVANVLGTAIDRQEALEELERERQLTAQIVETSPVGITVVDSDGALRFANDRAEELFDRPESKLNALTYDDPEWEELDVDGTPIEDGDRPFDRIMATGEPVFDHVSSLQRGDDERIWTSVSGAPLFDGDEPRAAVFAIEDVTERRRYERRLERQRAEVAALNELHGVVQGITDAIIEQPTRDRIESIVCERLAASDSYRFAWIGEVDAETQEMTMRHEAGVEGYLDDVTISVDPDDERSDGPTGRAVKTRTVQTTQNVRTDTRYEPWRDRAAEYGFRSSAAIPIVYEDTLYGVLSVYAERSNAFTGGERTVIGQLGEIVGHAIASVERRRALTSDEIIELEIRIQDVFETMGVDVETDERITINRLVPLDDGSYLEYGTTSEAGFETIEKLLDAYPHWRAVSVIEENFGEVSFEIELSEAPIIALTAAHGGSIVEAVLERDDLSMTVHLPPQASVRSLIESLQTEFPTAEVLARRQKERSETSLQQVWGEELTDRQRTALETAFFAGFFEWPRSSSGEDVAETLDISASTFHHHVREAERKLFGALFDEFGTGDS